MTGLRSILAALVIATLCAPPLLVAEKDRQTFAAATDVIFVEVPVYVVDRAGEPVAGLTAADFEILDNGQPRPLESAELIDLATLDPAGPMAARRAAERLPAAGRRHFLLLFDTAFSSPRAITKARRAARQFALESLHPTDLAAAAVYSRERGLDLLVTFSPDRAQVARAIDGLGTPGLVSRARDPLRFLVDEPEDTHQRQASSLDTNTADIGSATGSLLAGRQLEESGRAFERGRVSSWARALGEMAQILGQVEGRKHILYFSEGFDGRLLLGREADPQDPRVQQDSLLAQRGLHWLVDTDQIYGNDTLQRDIEDMIEQLRRADCVLQAIDIGGLAADSAAGARADRVGQDALFYMAHGTGGELYEDANRFGPQLERALASSRLTYLLTFRADDLPQDGSYRRLKVEVAGHKGRVSHRAGYYAPRPFAELHPLEKKLLAANTIASAEPRRDIAIDLLAAPFRAGSDAAYVPVIIEANGDDLLRGQRGGRLEAEIYAYVTDSTGTLRDHFSQIVTLDHERAEAELGKGLKFYGHLVLEPGTYRVRVLVRNAETGRTGASSLGVEVPAFSAGEPVLLPPFFPEALGSWLLMRDRAAVREDGTVVNPFTLNGELFIPAARPRLRPGSTPLYLVGYGLVAGQLEISGQILDSTGEAVLAPRLELLERTASEVEGLDKLRLELQLGELPAGSYTLRVELAGADGAEPVSSSARFRI